MRSSLLPVVLVLLLLGLVLLLPRRSGDAGPADLPAASTAGADIAAALVGLPVLEVIEPPPWVLSHGTDVVQRALDRLAWGTASGLLATRDVIAAHGAPVQDEVLARLRLAGENDPIQVAKLLAMLGEVGGDDPEVVDELVRRALSENGLVAKAALRVLAGHPSPAALAGILDRRQDSDLDVGTTARGALAQRARAGDVEALEYILQDLRLRLAEPDPAYLAVLGEVPSDPRVLEVLRGVVAEANYDAALHAQGALLAHGDAQAESAIEAMLLGRDPVSRLNALLLVVRSGRVVGQAAWGPIVRSRNRDEVLRLMPMLDRAVQTGDESAPQAVALLEEIAFDPAHSCQVEATDLLFLRGHEWAVERTRLELMDEAYVGAHLGLVIDRIRRADRSLSAPFTELAFERIARPSTGEIERLMLRRLVAELAPERASEDVIRAAMEGDPALVAQLLPSLPALGRAGLLQAAQQLDSDRGAGLVVYLAAQTGLPEALPLLEAVALDGRRHPALRQQALDAIVRVRGGPREDALRRVATALDDPEVSQRARLLFWNYL